ncbi:response regulator [Burkholderia ubonensis]|uniref:XRE family transcriptional regulator n=1 Tax=Burkholderia ubonensis TaxID=101571 RepID=A0A117WGY5_9BURK|nr:response regulator [Burkholderia ubonensis]AOI68766.1 XRE family transcriptional regulator [Burkholderia ubonensis]KUZ18036.1 XRE family transcriptional regulator [Burkholderia ubonensis]KUZ22799.1 XRE family transcriptional regulator [Burkholderia ubonensis]KUZ37726.1 XRE family transcriptional regulator [Burkholderia ubonensis]KUZ46609.1 XRE family transcriptional regulator [Burkholderia ubonensis]
MTIRILLIDDHTLFRSGVRALLQREADFDVVGEAADGLEGLKRAKQFLPDVILLDLNMPGLSGLETLKLLVQDLHDTAVVMLTVSEEVDELTVALREGACGYLLKNIEADTLAASIRKAAAGQPVIADDMTAKLVARLRGPAPAPAPAGDGTEALTTRENDIMRELARGASNKEIARVLDLAESTVKIHVRNILRKLNLTSRVQVAIYAVGRESGSADAGKGTNT